MSARSSAPTSSIRSAAACSRSSARCGSPASISSIHSRANPPSRMSASSRRMFSRTCSSITRGPRVRSPYSAVSEIE